MLFLLATRQLPCLGGKDVAAALQNPTFTHSTGPAAAAGRRQKYLGVGQSEEQVFPGRDQNRFRIIIDKNFAISVPDNLRLNKSQYENDAEDDPGKNNGADNNKS
jgi:hypothetical protein